MAGWGGGCRPREGRRGRELAPRPLARRASVVGLPPRESSLAPQAAFGCRCPGGGGSGVGDGLAPRGGGPRWWRGWGRVFRSAVVRRPALGGGGVSRRPAGARLPPAPRPRCLSPPPRVRGPCPLPGRHPRGPRPVGAGGSRPRPSPRARPRPGDACLGGDPRDAAASARRCALSPRAVAVPRFAPRRSRREGAVCGGAGDRGRVRAVCPSPVWASAAARVPTPGPPLRRRPPRPSRGRRLVLPAPPRLLLLRRRRRRLLPEGRRSVGVPCVRGEGGPGRSAAGLRVSPFSGPSSRAPSETRPQIRRGDPLNLSILVSGGKETNQDSLSNGE